MSYIKRYMDQPIASNLAIGELALTALYENMEESGDMQTLCEAYSVTSDIVKEEVRRLFKVDGMTFHMLNTAVNFASIMCSRNDGEDTLHNLMISATDLACIAAQTGYQGGTEAKEAVL